MAAAQNFFGSMDGATWMVVIALAIVGLVYLRRRRRPDARGTELGQDFAVVEPTALSADLPVEHEDPDLVERVAISNHIADLMLEDEWGEIAALMAEWENQLAAAPGGARYHDVAAFTALSGLQHLIDQAPRNSLDDLAEAEIEVGHFVNTYQHNPESHVLAVLAARAHLLIGEACRADHWPEAIQHEVWRRMARHFLEAGEIIANYDALAYMSPLLAEAHYVQSLGSPGGRNRLDDHFATWISLDPSNPAIYERHAERLADTDAFDDAFIQAEAERALDRTVETLGFGGYALFFLPLLDLREGARELLDNELFAAAMLDLASMEASQAEVNQTANALALETRALRPDNQALKDTLYLLISSHMTVIYPRLWSMPEPRVQSLVQDAAHALGDITPVAANSQPSDIWEAA